MDNLTRVREASVRVARIQRRILLLQTLFWPTLVITVLGLAAIAGSWVWRQRRPQVPAAAPGAPAVPQPVNGHHQS